MSGGPGIDIPEEFFKYARWLNLKTLALGPHGMVAAAANGALTTAERPICRAFIDEVLRRVTDDQKLLELLKNSTRLYIEKPEGARYLLTLMRDAL